MNHKSAYLRPQRELSSLKTDDIEGAIGKHKIHDRKLVYESSTHQEYKNEGSYIAGQYNELRQTPREFVDLRNLPDPYELEMSVKKAPKFDGDSLRQLSEALKQSVVYSRERGKYKMPNEREIFLHNYENIQDMLQKQNRRRYKSGISTDNPFYRGVVLPPGIIKGDPIKIPKNRKDVYSIPDNVSDADKQSENADLLLPQQQYIPGNHQEEYSGVRGPEDSEIRNYQKFEKNYTEPSRSGMRDPKMRDAVTSQIMGSKYNSLSQSQVLKNDFPPNTEGNSNFNVRASYGHLNDAYRRLKNPGYMTINDSYGMF